MTAHNVAPSSNACLFNGDAFHAEYGYLCRCGYLSVRHISDSSPIRWKAPGTSLVVQWMVICLPVQGTKVQSPVREDPTCCGAVSLCATTTEVHVTRAYLYAEREASMVRSLCASMKSSHSSAQLGEAQAQQRRPSTAKINK